jgi:hypothetical protein
MALARIVPWVVLSLLLSCASGRMLAQSQRTAAGAPPKILLLVYQQILPGKAGERQKLEADTSRRFDELNVPITWIELEAVTGPPQALFFDPANSFVELAQAGTMLATTLATHPELAEQQQQIEERLASSKTMVAVRRDDLGLGAERIDLTKARHLRITTVSLRPGHERDFVEAQGIRNAATEHDRSEPAWVIYEVNSGTTQPTFLIVEALRSMADADKELDRARNLQQSLAEPERRRLEQIIQQGYVSVESNLYAMHPDMSHVPKEFVAGDPAFWNPAGK